MKLFQDTDDLQEFLPVNQGFTLENMQDDLEDSFSRFIVSRVGLEQIAASRDETDEIHVELIRLIKRANANLGFMLHFAQAKVTVSDKGVTYPGKQEDSQQATEKDKQDLYVAIRAKGFQALEDMLIHLSKNLEVFTHWATSDGYADFNSLLIRTAKEFKLIKGSYLIFLEMYEYIEAVEIEVIQPQVNSDVLSSVRTALKDSTLSLIQSQLLNQYLRPTIAYLAMSRAVSANAIARNSSGALTIYDDNTYEKASVTLEKNNRWHADLLEAGNNRLSLMTSFIAKNMGEFGFIISDEDVSDFKPFRNDEKWGTCFF